MNFPANRYINYLKAIKLFLWLLFLLSLSRLFFYTLNINYFSTPPVKTFFYGILFDISIISYFNVIIIAALICPYPCLQHPLIRRIFHIIFVIINALAIGSNCIDAKFFEFEQKRLTADIFSSVWLGEDFITLIPHFLLDFWYVVVVWLVFVFFLIKIFPRSVEKNRNYTSPVHYLIFIVFIASLSLGARGSTGLKPLRLLTAGKYASPKNIPLLINSPFSIIHSFGSQNLKPVEYFNNDDSLTAYFRKVKHYTRQVGQKKNVVIIFLESFSREYIGFYNHGKGFTPFLDSLARQSLVFTNAYANGKKSIEAVPSVIASLPALMENPYITSIYSGCEIQSVATTLGEMGYKSIFYHGGKNGTMGFNIFCKLAGFNYYSGLDEYPDKKDYDDNWGIYDEPYLKFAATNMDTLPQPFLSCVFTLSSHHPYKIPEKYKNRFPLGRLVNHQSIAYADYALSRFFETAKHQSWYQNTLFVLTADHTAQSEGGFYSNKVGMYAIPVILFSPSDSLLKGTNNNIAQHIDIMPTILQYTGYNKPFVAFGRSLFEKTTHPVNITYLNGVYQATDSSHVLFFNGSEVLGYYNYLNDTSLKINLYDPDNKEVIDMEKQLKAVIQSYNQGLIKNQLHISKIKTENPGQ